MVLALEMHPYLAYLPLEMLTFLLVFALEMVRFLVIFALEMKKCCIFAPDFKGFRYVRKNSY